MPVDMVDTGLQIDTHWIWKGWWAQLSRWVCSSSSQLASTELWHSCHRQTGGWVWTTHLSAFLLCSVSMEFILHVQSLDMQGLMLQSLPSPILPGGNPHHKDPEIFGSFWSSEVLSPKDWEGRRFFSQIICRLVTVEFASWCEPCHLIGYTLELSQRWMIAGKAGWRKGDTHNCHQHSSSGRLDVFRALQVTSK